MDRPRSRVKALLLTGLNQPEALCNLSLPDWDLLLRTARRVRLLGRLEAKLAHAEYLDQIPPRAADHLRAARTVIEHRNRLATWELNRLLWAVKDVDCPLVLLKGAAYLLAALPLARGRLFADLDILVPESKIPEIENACLNRGWYSIKLHPYDERYYRVWMHEIPPLRHRERGTEIDIHHRLLPRTSRLASNPGPLFAATCPLENPRLAVLQPADMVLHALIHLFLEGDPHDGLRLRDLVDAHDLLEHFGKESSFWETLVPRARELGFERPLYYGLRYARRILGTLIPEEVMRTAEAGAPAQPIRAIMDCLIPLALWPDHPDHPSRAAALARNLVYLRSHWLRMPPLLLIRHLGFKAWLRLCGKQKQADLTRLDLGQQ